MTPEQKAACRKILQGYTGDLQTMQVALEFERSIGSELVPVYEKRMAQIWSFLEGLSPELENLLRD
jgi:hypothetical protein